MHGRCGCTVSTLPRPCVDCGEPTRDGTRCGTCTDEHHPPDHRDYSQRQTTAARGYGAAWQKLSRRARALQPWCEDCGNSHPADLTTDHSPEAWDRVATGLPVRLVDVAVVCRACNSARGAARGAARGGHGGREIGGENELSLRRPTSPTRWVGGNPDKRGS